MQVESVGEHSPFVYMREEQAPASLRSAGQYSPDRRTTRHLFVHVSYTFVISRLSVPRSREEGLGKAVCVGGGGEEERSS